MKFVNLVLSIVFAIFISFLTTLEIVLTPLKIIINPLGFNGPDLVFIALTCILTILFYKIGVKKILANLIIILGVELTLLAPILFVSLKLGLFNDFELGILPLMGFLFPFATLGLFVGLILVGVGILILRKQRKNPL